MKLLCFSVHDGAVKAFLPPWYARARGEALRQFVEACNDDKSNFKKFAADYTLMYLGEFDDASGTFEGASASGPERVIGALEVIEERGVQVLPPNR